MASLMLSLRVPGQVFEELRDNLELQQRYENLQTKVSWILRHPFPSLNCWATGSRSAPLCKLGSVSA